jgi:tetratricopeptide (TPR) repeat protein
MNYKIFLLTAILFTSTQTIISAQKSNNEVIATIALMNPKSPKPIVVIKRNKNKNKITARESEKLYKNDLLTVPKISKLKIKIVCRYNGYAYQLTPGLDSSVNNNCPTSPPTPPRRPPTPPPCGGGFCPLGEGTDYSIPFSDLDDSRIKRISTELKKIISEGSQSPFVYRNLGEAYVDLAQFEQAEPLFLKAIQLAKASRDMEELTAAQTRLNELYKLLGKK